jgi:ATP-dependent Clp protease adaptor protein ClpS
MGSRALQVPRPVDVAKGQTAHEPLYRVIVHNDDLTPMEFVIQTLSSIFLMPEINAATIAYSAHLTGRAYVQTLPRPEARRRVNKAHFAARLKGYPLEFSMEPE